MKQSTGTEQARAGGQSSTSRFGAHLAHKAMRVRQKIAEDMKKPIPKSPVFSTVIGLYEMG